MPGDAVVVLMLFASSLSVGQPDKHLTNSIDMKLVRIEAGAFDMGTGAAPPTSRDEWLTRDWDESPVHRVVLSTSFYLGVYEVTNAEFERFDPKHRELRGKFGHSSKDNEPVSHVSWQQAVDFCRWLSEREGKTYRLPTEAEWEYACRAGGAANFNTGDTLTAEQANFGLSPTGAKRTALPVGSFKPNAWGLHDMHGNVAEWCHDWYGPYEAGQQTDPVGRTDGDARVVRGWSHAPLAFQSAARYCRSANRSGHLPDDANRYTGFRVVLGEMPSTKPLPRPEPALFQQKVLQRPAPKSDMDPAKPYFVDFTKNGKSAKIPPNTFGPIFSSHNHFSAAVACPNGDVLAVWYTTVSESGRECSQAVSRLRAGSDRWEPASAFFNIPDVNCHAPVLLRDGQRLYHFCTQSLHGWDYSTNILRYSDDNGATWSRPRIMVRRDAPFPLSQPCSAFVANDGALVLACDGNSHKDERLMISTDKGETWQVAKGDMRASAGGRYVIHPAIIERSDGAILSFLRGPHPMPLLVSKDRGESWQAEDAPFDGISVGQKAIALRLASGAMLFLTFDRSKTLGGGAMTALSLDEGKSWAHARKVEAPVSGYMSLAQADDGMIYLIGSRMNFAACNEAWLRQGKAWPGRAAPAP